LKLIFQTVAEKTAKNFRGLLYFAAPGIWHVYCGGLAYSDVFCPLISPAACQNIAEVVIIRKCKKI